MNRHLVTPYLMGQRRDGLARVTELDHHGWDVLLRPDYDAVHLDGANEKLRRMGGVYALLAGAVERVARAGQRPVSVAGDCVSTLGVLAGLQRAGKTPDRILWLDAHGDFHTWATSQTKYLGGMPLAMLVGRDDRRRGERNAIDAMRREIGVQPYPEERIILSDARDLDPGEKESLEASAITVCDIEEIPGYLLQHESLYLHWDTDVLDASVELPSLKYQVSGGPGIAQLAELFRLLKSFPLLAVSVSAWHEEQDTGDRAASACLALLSELD
ncbi:arginase family protein [Pseudoduganella namucuonensis]|uniref:Arginase n=1 Tax=Pseudoduganella namucuonensis TaxID=1035707 RepID=A0A1I7KP62_9BURK|nr:arginase family protein [Pseudoduganella namucuonensis]SFU99232.1 arginase [Pseudoduganella namucuonensis]